MSHFDLDHVNLIPYLKDAFPRTIYVFLPLLNSAEKNILVNTYNLIYKEPEIKEVIALIENPEDFLIKKRR